MPHGGDRDRILFVITCTDKAGPLDLRPATQPPHLEYLKALEAFLVLAGPVLDSDG